MSKGREDKKKPELMKYIESWLKGLGLENILPKLEAQGITTPKKLAALSLKDMYEVGKLGALKSSASDGLFFETGPIILLQHYSHFH